MRGDSRAAKQSLFRLILQGTHMSMLCPTMPYMNNCSAAEASEMPRRCHLSICAVCRMPEGCSMHACVYGWEVICTNMYFGCMEHAMPLGRRSMRCINGSV